MSRGVLDSEAMISEVDEAAAHIRAAGGPSPRVGIILGTGLGALADQIQVACEIPYDGLPHFPLSTVETHTGRLIVGTLEGTPVVAMQGRFHRYEGHDLQEVTFPVRVMGRLGCEVLVVSNACGGMNPRWGPGDLVVIDDHVNLLCDNPLIGENLTEFGPRFPDLSEPYDRGLQEIAREEAMQLGIPLRTGVYVAVEGPNLETRAEYRMLQICGADVVGMSTVPEVIVARHMGIRVLGISVITDQCLPDALEEADLDTIIATAQGAEPQLTRLIGAVVARL